MRSLRFRVLALTAVLVLLSQIGTIAAVLQAAGRDIPRRADALLSKATAMTTQLAHLRVERLHAAAVAATRLEPLQPALAGDPDALAVLLEKHRQRARVDLVMLVDQDGRVLAGTPDPQVLTGLAWREQPEAGAQRHGSVWLDDGLLEIVGVPVDAGGGPAWLVTGLRIDTELAERLAGTTGFGITFLADDAEGVRVLGSSLGSSLVGAGGLQLPEDVSSSHDVRMQVGGAGHVGRLVPLPAGPPGIRLLVSQPLSEVMAPYAAFRGSILLVGGLTLCLALAGSVFLSRTVTRPLQRLVTAARRIRDGNYSSAVDADSGGEIGELALAFTAMQAGIAERETRIARQAQYDAVTGLPSRLRLTAELHTLLAEGRADGHPVSLMAIDLGDLGDIGVSLGQETADALRREAAERLRGILEPRSLVARLEGDQFVAVLQGCTAVEAADQARELVHLLDSGLAAGDVNASIAARIGIAGAPEHAGEPGQLLHRACVARNEAREQDLPVFVYQQGDEKRRADQRALLSGLRRAVRRDELRLYLQPRIRVRDGHVCGAEALVRWQHPTLGLLPPDRFIPLAEQTGHISLITTWALSTAIRECRLWVEEGMDLSVSVNLSGRDLHDRNLPCQVLELLRDHDLEARYLVLEITEKAMVKDLESAAIVLTCLRDVGVRIAVDDFGTGYSSLAQLRDLPVDELKIDRSFVKELPARPRDAAIVAAAIHLAHDLGLEVLAEGVESRAALGWLHAHGCQQAQGYFFAAPMPAEEFGRWVRQQARPVDAGFRIAS